MGWRNSREPSVAKQQMVVLVLISLMAVVLGLQQLVPPLLEFSFMLVPAEIVTSWKNLGAGSIGSSDLHAGSTLLTNTFMHASIEHFASNMLFYWIFGALINEVIGWRWLLLTVGITALGGSVMHVAMNPEEVIPLLGASGVVSGFMGVYLGLAVRWRLPDPQIWPIASPVPPANLALLAVVFVAMDYVSIFNGGQDLVAFGAHVGGFTSGLFFASFAIPQRAQQASGR